MTGDPVDDTALAVLADLAARVGPRRWVAHTNSLSGASFVVGDGGDGRQATLVGPVARDVAEYVAAALAVLPALVAEVTEGRAIRVAQEHHDAPGAGTPLVRSLALWQQYRTGRRT